MHPTERTNTPQRDDLIHAHYLVHPLDTRCCCHYILSYMPFSSRSQFFLAGRLTSRNNKPADRAPLAGRRNEQLFGLTAGFLTFARLIVPLRIALALALTPAADKYIVKGLLNKSSEAADVDVAEVRVPRRGIIFLSVPQDEILGDLLSWRGLVIFNYTAQPLTFCPFDGCWHPPCSARVIVVCVLRS